MGCPEGITPSDLVSLSDLLRDSRTGGSTIVCAPTTVDEKSKGFLVTRSGRSTETCMYESVTLDILSKVLEVENSFCCYWKDDVSWYTYKIQSNNRSMWTCVASLGVARTIRPIGLSGSRAMLFFHTDPLSSAGLTVNCGVAKMDIDNMKETFTKYSVASSVCDLTNAVLSDNRCYFCSYVVSVHNAVLAKQFGSVSDTYLIKLTPEFAALALS